MKQGSAELINRDLTSYDHVVSESPLLTIVSDIEPTYQTHGLVEVAGNSIRVTAEYKESCTNPRATLFGNGFGGFKSSGSNTSEAIAQSGELVLTFDQPRRDNRSLFNDIIHPQSAYELTIEAAFKFLQTEAFKREIPETLQLDPEQQKLVLLSMAGIPGTYYAHNNPDIVSDVVYVSSAGFGRPLSVPGLFRTAKLMNEVIQLSQVKSCQLTPKLLVQSVLHHANLLRNVGELGSCVATRIHNRAAELSAKTVYIDAQHDLLIPPDKNKERYVDAYRLLKDMGHFAILINPEVILSTANEALNSLENHSKTFDCAA